MAGHIVEAGTLAYWVTYLGDSPIFTPCKVTRVEATESDDALATFQTRHVQSAGIVGAAVVARKATGIVGGARVIQRPSIGVPDDKIIKTEEV